MLIDSQLQAETSRLQSLELRFAQTNEIINLPAAIPLDNNHQCHEGIGSPFREQVLITSHNAAW